MEESLRTIKQLSNKRCKSTNIDEKGTNIIKKEISNGMNNYFRSVGRDLVRKIDEALNPLLSGDYDISPQKNSSVFN